MLNASDAPCNPAVNDQSASLDDLLIVIVLYGTIPDNSFAYTSVRKALMGLRSTPEIYIYDNSPTNALISAKHVTYFHDPGNSGVSAAYNMAAVHAGQKEKKWLLFLDQDTIVTDRLFSAFNCATRAHAGSVVFAPRMFDRHGMLSPFRFFSGGTRRIRRTQETLPLNTYRFINSGLIIRLSAFVKAGGYDENAPLDFSDMCFAERLRKVTDHFVILDVTLQHEFSNNEQVPVESAVARFHYFCTGAAAMGKHTGHSGSYLLRTLLRACRLTIRYRDRRFLIRFLRFVLHG